MNKNVPPILHRYFDYKDGLKTLKKCSLHFSTTGKYNDPFELMPAAASDLFKYPPKDIRREIAKIAETEEGKKKIQKIEKELGLDDVVMGASVVASAIVYPYLTAAIATGLFLLGLTDETDNIKLFATKYFSVFAKVKSCCFSELYDSILMWSHYADGHNGIVLSFDTFMNYWGGEEFREINYTNKRIGLPKSSSDANEYIWGMLTQKSEVWSYEHEYRMIKFGMDQNVMPINPKALKAIRLGLNVDDVKKDEILQIRDQKYKDTPIYHARINPNEYKLDFKEL